MGAMTNFPDGFADGVTIRGIPISQAQTGQVFFVGNSTILNRGAIGGSNSNSGSFLQPFATLNYAINSRCVQGRGDIIFVLPHHRETFTDATGLIFGCAGVAVIGLGSGDARPTFIFGAAAAAIPVRSSQMSIQNCLMLGNFVDVVTAFDCIGASHTASITGTTLTSTTAGTGLLYPGVTLMGSGIESGTIITKQLTGTTGSTGTYEVNISQTFASGTVTAGPHDLEINDCEFSDNSAILNFLVLVTGPAIANAMNGLRLVNSKKYGLSTLTATYIIETKDDQKGITVSGCDIVHQNNENGTLIWQDTNSDTLLDVDISYNTFYPVGLNAATGVFIITSASDFTGVVHHNNVFGLRAIATATLVTAASGLHFWENYYHLAADKSGVLLPAVQG